LNGFFSLRSFCVLDERESSRAARLAVDRHRDLEWSRNRTKVRAQIRLSGAVRQIANEQTNGQINSLLGW
jgi:hypothetical protein